MSIKILLADDSVTIQKVIGIIFGGEEYSLAVVDNGKAAVEKALEIIPDIMLIDALMPGMSGYEVCEQVRANPALAAKPILLLTGSFEPFDETKAKSCGADDFISKPFESQQIIAKVTELYELSASRSFETGQSEMELPATPPPLPEESVPAVEPEPAAQPQDIWEAFTPAEPEIDAFAASSDTDMYQEELQAEETVSSPWVPVDEQAYVFEEQAAADLPAETAAEAPQEEEAAFGDVSFEEVVEPELAAVSEQPAVFDEPVEYEEPSESVESVEMPEETLEAAGDGAGALPTALTEEQLRVAIAGVSKEVIERIVWEVVPDLAEALIKEAIRKIKEGQ